MPAAYLEDPIGVLLGSRSKSGLFSSRIVQDIVESAGRRVPVQHRAHC